MKPEIHHFNICFRNQIIVLEFLIYLKTVIRQKKTKGLECHLHPDLILVDGKIRHH